MVEAFLPLAGGLDEDGEVFLHLLLPDIFRERFRAQRVLDLGVLRDVFRGDHPVFEVVLAFPVRGKIAFVVHGSGSPFHSLEPISRRERRISSSVGRALSNFATTEAASLGV